MMLKLPDLDARIPEWNHNDLVERICPICSSSEAEQLFERPDKLTVRLCNKCKAYFISPSPSEIQLNDFYSKYDEIHRRGVKLSASELAAFYETVDPFSNRFVKELSSLMRFEGAQVLDIGFGRALFLYCIKKLGGVPYGLELDQQAIDLAKSIGINNVYRKHISEFNVQEKFDLITLIDLVEHPLSPMDLLTKSSELLKNGGYLAIWTPNGDFARHEEYPTTFRVDLEHMQYLTPDACQFIASKMNLKMVHLETLGFAGIADIDKPVTRLKNNSVLHLIKKILRSVPGVRLVNNLRHKLRVNKERDERTGAYHLFCILQKPI